jgi:hypothetical protein
LFFAPYAAQANTYHVIDTCPILFLDWQKSAACC